MTIYRIYKIVNEFEWSPYNDDMIQIDNEETVEYVDSKEKVDAFFAKIEEEKGKCEKCLTCPIISLTKRKYNNQKNCLDSYCDKKNLFFKNNSVFCKNEKHADAAEYGYEEIIVR